MPYHENFSCEGAARTGSCTPVGYNYHMSNEAHETVYEYYLRTSKPNYGDYDGKGKEVHEVIVIDGKRTTKR